MPVAAVQAAHGLVVTAAPALGDVTSGPPQARGRQGGSSDKVTCSLRKRLWMWARSQVPRICMI